MNTIELNGGKDYVKWRIGMAGTAELFDIAVNTERGIGIGTRLVEILIDQLHDLNIHTLYAFCRDDNEEAIKFYKKLGFTVSVVHKFYKSGNAVLVVKYL